MRLLSELNSRLLLVKLPAMSSRPLASYLSTAVNTCAEIRRILPKTSQDVKSFAMNDLPVLFTCKMRTHRTHALIFGGIDQ